MGSDRFFSLSRYTSLHRYTAYLDESVIKHAAVADCLECGICKSLLQEPRVMPCGHTFCSACIAKLWTLNESAVTGKTYLLIQCPECRAIWKEPEEEFPVNYKLLGLPSAL